MPSGWSAEEMSSTKWSQYLEWAKQKALVMFSTLLMKELRGDRWRKDLFL
jgi:hypothetical protein